MGMVTFDTGLNYYVVQLNMAICLTNKIHVAVRLFSNRPRMKSKCGKNK